MIGQETNATECLHGGRARGANTLPIRGAKIGGILAATDPVESPTGSKAFGGTGGKKFWRFFATYENLFEPHLGRFRPSCRHQTHGAGYFGAPSFVYKPVKGRCAGVRQLQRDRPPEFR